ncbi:MAG: hypothetical protein ABH803_03875 [Candidatus Micrarchaeota archaeon]
MVFGNKRAATYLNKFHPELKEILDENKLQKYYPWLWKKSLEDWYLKGNSEVIDEITNSLQKIEKNKHKEYLKLIKHELKQHESKETITSIRNAYEKGLMSNKRIKKMIIVDYSNAVKEKTFKHLDHVLNTFYPELFKKNSQMEMLKKMKKEKAKTISSELETILEYKTQGKFKDFLLEFFDAHEKLGGNKEELEKELAKNLRLIRTEKTKLKLNAGPVFNLAKISERKETNQITAEEYLTEIKKAFEKGMLPEHLVKAGEYLAYNKNKAYAQNRFLMIKNEPLTLVEIIEYGNAMKKYEE